MKNLEKQQKIGKKVENNKKNSLEVEKPSILTEYRTRFDFNKISSLAEKGIKYEVKPDKKNGFDNYSKFTFTRNGHSLSMIVDLDIQQKNEKYNSHSALILYPTEEKECRAFEEAIKHFEGDLGIISIFESIPFIDELEYKIENKDYIGLIPVLTKTDFDSLAPLARKDIAYQQQACKVKNYEEYYVLTLKKGEAQLSFFIHKTQLKNPKFQGLTIALCMPKDLKKFTENLKIFKDDLAIEWPLPEITEKWKLN